jgi:predicted nucleic acid-binding protein
LAARDGQVVTVDTNIAFYALAREGEKALKAKEVLATVSFLSVQVLNEYANAARRKLRRDWNDIAYDLDLLRTTIPDIHSIDGNANSEAVRLAARYQLSFYDSLLLAVAVANGASIFYSEDMQHGLVIDEKMTIINPFLEPEPI